MDPDPAAAWIQRLVAVVRSQQQVRVMICGHVHRAAHGLLAGKVVAIAPASASQLTLDLTPIDMTRPDGRELLVEEPAGFGLVLAEAGQITTHICVAGKFRPAVSYTSPFQRA